MPETPKKPYIVALQFGLPPKQIIHINGVVAISPEMAIADMIERRRTKLVSTWHAGKRREIERQIERLQTLLREETAR